MPIHLIWGDDCAAIDLAIERLIKDVVAADWERINLSRFDGSDSGQAIQALSEIRTPPLGTGDRLVLVKQSPFCNSCSNELAQGFEQVLNMIPSNNHLVLHNKNKPDKRLRTTKALQSHLEENNATERSFVLPPVWDEKGQRELVARTAQELNLEIEPQAISLLVEMIGNDSTRLVSELKKVSLLATNQESYIRDNQRRILLTAKHINDLVEGNATNALKVGESLLQNNLGEALIRIHNLLERGEPPLRMLATLTGQVRGWLWISLLEEHGEKDVSVIAKAAGIANPKRIYILRKQITGKSPKQFLQLLSSLLEIESTLKRGVMPEDAFKDGLLGDKSLR